MGVPPDTEDTLIAGRYRRLGTIGVGGMARVVLAEDERLRRRVAIKALHADSPEDTAQRFEREARLGASLNHPNLVSVYDVVTDRESVLIVMEYVDGRTLKDALAEAPLEEEMAMSVICDVAAGLDHAHAEGVVHRDVKPANILIRADGVAKLADLGIATAAESTRITRSGIVLGTAVYMAPEQLEGEEAGSAADVYSLAAVAFEALSGKKAREGSSPLEIAHRAATGPPPDLLEAWPDAPPAAAQALARGMTRDPRERQASAGDLASDLRDALGAPDSGPVVAEAEPTVAMERTAVPRVHRAPPPPPPRSPAPGPTPRRRLPSWLPAAAALLALCAVAAVALASMGGSDDDPGSSSGGSKQAEERRGSRDRTDSTPAAAPAPAPAEAESEESPPPDPSGEIAPESADPSSLNDQGFALMNEGRYDEAIPLLQQAVNSYPEGSSDLTYAFALFNLGRSLRLDGRPDEAIPILERRLEIPNQTATVQRELDAARAAAG